MHYDAILSALCSAITPSERSSCGDVTEQQCMERRCCWDPQVDAHVKCFKMSTGNKCIVMNMEILLTRCCCDANLNFLSELSLILDLDLGSTYQIISNLLFYLSYWYVNVIYIYPKINVLISIMAKRFQLLFLIKNS